jgi:hypothetical protein
MLVPGLGFATDGWQNVLTPAAVHDQSRYAVVLKHNVAVT